MSNTRREVAVVPGPQRHDVVDHDGLGQGQRARSHLAELPERAAGASRQLLGRDERRDASRRPYDAARRLFA